MVQKFYNIVYGFFLIESILILTGIIFDKISYGIDVQTPFMAIGIFLGILTAIFLRIILRNLNATNKWLYSIIISFLMIFFCFYYLLEDNLKFL